MDQFSYIANADVVAIEALYGKYKEDPNSVDSSWQNFFKGFDFSQQWNGDTKAVNSSGPVNSDKLRKEMEVVHLVRGYRSRGHLLSNTNPIGPRTDRQPLLDLKDFNLSEADLDLTFDAGVEVFGRPAKLSEIIDALKKVYTSRIGFEYLYIRDREAKNWLRNKIEREYLNFQHTLPQRKRIAEKLNQAVHLENFIHTKFLGKKRFSLEGGESTIAGIDAAINRGAELGVEEVVIGMAHRGRLNVLTNILQKPYEQVFLEFKEEVNLEEYSDGDVKYHMGYSSDMTAMNGNNVSLRLMPNPSHLEAVNPVVVGYARARADENYNHIAGQDKYDPVLPIIIHGDAALAGQGIVYEVTQMSNLPAYYTGGTLHFVINNQVGFTTDFGDARSSIYCSDIAKIVDAPIFHVSGDDPEGVCYVMQLAIEFRQKFNRDVYVDMVCYRKYGHNESDEPRMTQPTMYKVISQHVNPRDLYLKELQSKGIDTAWFQPIYDAFDAKLQGLLEAVLAHKVHYEFGKIGNTKLDKAVNNLRFSTVADFKKSPDTGISPEILKEVTTAMVTLPEGFTPLKQLEKVLEGRRQFLEGTKDADWAVGELLAYGSILKEGKIVRFTGQDVQRGTFSHRHAVLHDAETNQNYNSLAAIGSEKGRFEIYNSLLSEYGVMGFEFGYSIANPDSLVVWEAQFGDFANGAQMMIDQFIVACESKWRVMSGLVLLLPHGYEGQGPEHSNARPERFLQLSAEYNMYVCNVSTPANLFHMLRRQLAQPFRKPCINFTPKSGLRSFSSPKADFLSGGFKEIIGDVTVDAKKVKKVILCSGKIYYELAKKREVSGDKETAIVRVEQFHPFPKNHVETELKRYKNAKVIWVQEEPENMGYWSYILREFPEIGLGNCVSRDSAASPATGYNKKHDEEQASLIDLAFSI